MSFKALLPALTVASLIVAAASAEPPARSKDDGPVKNPRPEARRAFFGELHLHTGMSFDAWTFGTKLTPDQAYRFARGETVKVPAAQLQKEEGLGGIGDVSAKRPWPLDFMAVTDHSEWMGELTQLDDPDNPLAKTPTGQRLLKDPSAAFFVVVNAQRAGKPLPGMQSVEVMQHAWEVEQKAANANYRPGRFTTFIAYEWSATSKDRQNPSSPDPVGTIHRNVFFNSDHAPMPFTSNDSARPEDLWTYLEKTRAEGIDVIAIPHNGNLSGGTMYDWNDSDGRPIDERYALRRALNEPLTEIAQNKGQSETVPELSPNDEFANFEIYDRLLVNRSFKSRPDGSYIRQALGRGLAIQAKVGINPFKYGVVGASDIHNGLSTSLEGGMASGAFGIDPRTMTPKGDAARRALGLPTATPNPQGQAGSPSGANTDVLKFSSAGITGVWAEENTRDSIFAALKRKETFATSGTRIRVRMFAGWDFAPSMRQRRDWVAKAYANGVAMGGDLPVKPQLAKAPGFILEAMKDPEGANLDRIQVVKVWDDDGAYKERVFDVALSGARKLDRHGHAPAVGTTVNLASGGFTNTIGASELRTVWRDPEFDPSRPAVYYARVLEIPTPRWSTLLAIHNHLPIPSAVPATIQERAWTSPIWFTPRKS